MVEDDTCMDHDGKQALPDKVEDVQLNLFEELNSEHLQEKYYTETFGYTVSAELVLNLTLNRFNSHFENLRKHSHAT